MGFFAACQYVSHGATYLFAHQTHRPPNISQLQGLMIPNKKRAQRLDDRLRALGFHARASGIYKTAASASAAAKGTISTATPGAATAKQRTIGQSSKKGEAEGGGRKGTSSSAGSRPLTQEEKQESMAKMVEACRKRRPGTVDGDSGGTAEQRWMDVRFQAPAIFFFASPRSRQKKTLDVSRVSVSCACVQPYF